MFDSRLDESGSADQSALGGSDDRATRGQMNAMRWELGRAESPAFERLKVLLRTPFEISGAVISEIVQMRRHRCFADSQSFRKSRGEALWAELHWLTE